MQRHPGPAAVGAPGRGRGSQERAGGFQAQTGRHPACVRVAEGPGSCQRQGPQQGGGAPDPPLPPSDSLLRLRGQAQGSQRLGDTCCRGSASQGTDRTLALRT